MAKMKLSDQAVHQSSKNQNDLATVHNMMKVKRQQSIDPAMLVKQFQERRGSASILNDYKSEAKDKTNCKWN